MRIGDISGRALCFRFAPLLVALIALPMLYSSGIHRDYIQLGKSRLAIVRIPAGTFLMGTDKVLRADDHWNACSNCPSRNDVERPAHRVTISQGFWMGEFPVTQQQWQDVMSANPSYFRGAGPEAPVEQVSWKDVQQFLAKVNAMQVRWTLRLPTEAEWEYAARAGSTGETYSPLDSIAWYSENGSHTTHPVGQKLPNAFGLYDMLGNVWQWCQDWFGPYSTEPSIDPKGPSTGETRITRGGCFYCDSVHERAARRNRDLEDHSSQSIGFRVVAVPRKSTAKGVH
ncbi:MAG TPA: formylglycine-generating enzyme family protein [Silvibacterium sp.]|nr:formylglycine-generating enzyme family protein [Silvibacterium sp.]